MAFNSHDLPLETVPGPIFGATIKYGERKGYKESWSFERPGEARRILICNWSDANNFPVAMLGDVRPGAGGLLTRQIPNLHPNSTKQLYAVECNLLDGEGKYINDPGTGLIKFLDQSGNLDGLAVWEVTYRQLPFDVLPDLAVTPQTTELMRYVQREPKFAMESYTLPGNCMQWGSDGKPFPENTNIRRPLMELHYTWYWVPEPFPLTCWYNPPGNPPAGYAVIGSLNNAAFDGLNGNRQYSPGFLMAVAPEISERIWTPSGYPVRNVKYKFGLRPDAGWNRFYRAKLNDFDSLFPRKGGGRPPFTPGNFLSLFVLN